MTNFVVKQGGGVNRLAASLREGPLPLSSNVTTLSVHVEWGVALLGIALCCTGEEEFTVLCISVLDYSVQKNTSVYCTTVYKRTYQCTALQCTEEHISVLPYSVQKYTSVYFTTVYKSTHQCTASVKQYTHLLHCAVLHCTETTGLALLAVQ